MWSEYIARALGWCQLSNIYVTTNAILSFSDKIPYEFGSELILGIVSFSHSLCSLTLLCPRWDVRVGCWPLYFAFQRPWYHLVSGWVWSKRALVVSSRKKWGLLFLFLVCLKMLKYKSQHHKSSHFPLLPYGNAVWNTHH